MDFREACRNIVAWRNTIKTAAGRRELDGSLATSTYTWELMVSALPFLPANENEKPLNSSYHILVNPFLAFNSMPGVKLHNLSLHISYIYEEMSNYSC